MKHRRMSALALACLLLAPATARGEQTLEEALRRAREGRSVEALAMVDAALEASPDNARAHFTRGVILAEEGRRGEAAQVFRNLIRDHPELPEAYNNLAVIQASEGDFDGAVDTLKGALATNASYQTTYENLTRIFAQLASEAYSRALEVESAPARGDVELVMLVDLASAPAEPQPMMAEVKMAPAEPVLETTAEPAPMAESFAEPAVEEEPEAVTAPPALESEDLEMTESEPAAEPSAASDLAGLVEAWARAWSDQRVDDYLAFYDDDFAPTNGMTKQEWESNRRERLGVPEFIRVDVAILDSVAEGEDRASITFLQAYESSTFSDQVTKTLTLVKRESVWKILEEKSGS